MFSFNNKRRVEEDLEKIRVANLPEAERARVLAAKEAELAKGRAKVEKLRIKDYFAMVIAALSIVLPYALAIFGVLGAVILLFGFIYG